MPLSFLDNIGIVCSQSPSFEFASGRHFVLSQSALDGISVNSFILSEGALIEAVPVKRGDQKLPGKEMLRSLHRKTLIEAHLHCGEDRLHQI